MSQLNNTNENINNEEINVKTNRKMKSSTKIIIFLTIFLIVCVFSTIIAIYLTNKENISNVEINYPIEIANDYLGIKSITEQYNENDLKIIDISEKKGNRTPEHDWDTNTGKINIDYIKIDGLKNTSIENQINKEIKAVAYSFCNNSEMDNPKIDYVEISTYCEANFGNAISVRINKTIFYEGDEFEIDSTDYALNYDLTTGEKIKFKDLFTNSSLKNVLIQPIYDAVVSKYTFLDSPDGIVDMSKADLSTVEEETYIMLNKLINNIENIDFYYTPNYIYVYNYDLSISMADIYSHIAIYNRYKTPKNIFDGTFEGNKNMFVFSNRISYENIQYSKYEDVFDNYRVEVSIEMDNELLSESLAKEKLKQIIQDVEKEISKYEKKAKQNTKEAYVYTAYFTFYSGTSFELSELNIENNMLYTWGESKVYQMKKEYYDNVFKQKIASFYNNPEPTEYLPVFHYYEEDKSVNVKLISEINEEVDLNTNKTPEELIKEHGKIYIDQERRSLIEIKNMLNNGEHVDDLENELNAYYLSILSIKEEYNLDDDDIQEELDMINEIRNIEKNNNINSNINIIENTSLNHIIQNNIVN